MLCATVALAITLRLRRLDPGLYRPLLRNCLVMALESLALGAPYAPLILGFVLVASWASLGYLPWCTGCPPKRSRTRNQRLTSREEG